MSRVLADWQRWVRDNAPNFVGGEVQHLEMMVGQFRGPITSITVQGKTLVITTGWTAHRPTDGRDHGVGPWRKWTGGSPNRFAYDLSEMPGGIIVTSPPKIISEGRVFFTAPLNRVTLYPRGAAKLQRSDVLGM